MFVLGRRVSQYESEVETIKAFGGGTEQIIEIRSEEINRSW